MYHSPPVPIVSDNTNVEFVTFHMAGARCLSEATGDKQEGPATLAPGSKLKQWKMGYFNTYNNKEELTLTHSLRVLIGKSW